MGVGEEGKIMGEECVTGGSVCDIKFFREG